MAVDFRTAPRLPKFEGLSRNGHIVEFLLVVRGVLAGF